MTNGRIQSLNIIFNDNYSIKGTVNKRLKEQICFLKGETIHVFINSTITRNKILSTVIFNFFNKNGDECLVKIPINKIKLTEDVKKLIKDYSE